MTIYQQELLRKLASMGCAGQIDERDGILHVSMDGLPLCDQNQNGHLYWQAENLTGEGREAAFEAIRSVSRSIREYVSLYEKAPPMGIESVKEYRRLAEYGDTVLGGMYSEAHGFMFSTWDQSRDRKSLGHGDYSPSYEYAKESFITRAGLMDKERIFSQDEAANLYRCISFVQENCSTLTYEQEKQLDALLEKMTYDRQSDDFDCGGRRDDGASPPRQPAGPHL
ncbi:MAG: hypothetical protein ACI4L5_03440 [Negativibacillus sp.]